MNTVDYLLQNNFLKLDRNKQKMIVQLGPHQPEDFKLSVDDKKCKRNFKKEWFTKAPWLTVSLKETSMYCFYCLLYYEPGDSYDSFVKGGSQDIKHHRDKTTKHELSVFHLRNAYQYKSARLKRNFMTLEIKDTTKHNNDVPKNRHALEKVVQSLRFCCANKQLIGVQNNDKNLNSSVLDVLRLLGDVDSVLNTYLSQPSIENLTSSAAQQELMKCMYQVYLEDVKADIGSTNFVAMQVDEIADSSGQTYLCVILRYLIQGKLMERFVSLLPLDNRSPESVVNTVMSVVKEFNLEEKLVSQSFGAMSDSGQTAYTELRNTFPNSKYVHSYAHDLCHVVKYACSAKLRKTRLFFAQIAGFSRFFSPAFPKRCELLLSLLINPPKELPAAMKTNILMIVKEYKNAILECLCRIMDNDGWDLETVREAYHLKTMLQDESFLFLLNFFCDLMIQVNDFYRCFKMKSDGKTSQRRMPKAFEKFEQAVFTLSTNAQNCNDLIGDSNKRIKLEYDCDLTITAREACGVVINEIKERFSDSVLDLCDSFLIFNPNNLKNVENNVNQINHFASTFLPIIIKDKFRNEMTVVSELDTFRNLKNCGEVYCVIKETGLHDSFTEIFKALEIVLTIPVVTSETKRTFKTLLDIQSFVNQAPPMKADLNALTALVVHPDEITKIRDFNGHVIDLFAKSILGQKTPLVYVKDMQLGF